MTKLSQIVAIVKGVKNTAHVKITALHRDAQRTQKDGPLAGISRTYEPIEDGAERLPGESTLVQVKADGLLEQLSTVMVRMLDVTATQDWANCTATADVKVDGEVLLSDVPITYLMFLEKQLADLHTFMAKLPVLDPAETWHYDPNRRCYASEPVQTMRTKKIPRNHVLAEATTQHPAQVQVYYEDVPEGRWTTTKFSGALPADRVAELVTRVEKLQEAVRFAQSAANTVDVIDQHVGGKIFDYLLN